MPMNRLKNSRSTLFGVGVARRVGEADMGDAERRRIAAQRGQPLQKRRIRRPCQQRRQQRVFLRTGKIDVVDAGRLVILVVKIGPQDRARDAGHRFDREHPLGGNARPIRYRRLGNADAARKLGDATGGANRFLESPIWHGRSAPPEPLHFSWRDRLFKWPVSNG